MNRFAMQCLYFVIRTVFAAVIVGAIIIASQEFYIFPDLVKQIGPKRARDPKTLPAGVEESFITTEDGKSINVWYYPPPQPWDGMPVAIIFHGNAGTVETFFPLQQFLQKKGIASYLFDYRGLGLSRGWPTQKGLYLDGEAVFKHVLSRHPIPARDVILIGWSLGTGPASHLALSTSPRVLVLFAPYISLPSLVRDTTALDILTPFMRHQYPNRENLKQLPNTCVIIAHGEADQVIPIAHGQSLRDTFQWPQHLTFITSPTGDHFNMLGAYGEEMAEAIARCPIS